MLAKLRTALAGVLLVTLLIALSPAALTTTKRNITALFMLWAGPSSLSEEAAEQAVSWGEGALRQAPEDTAIRRLLGHLYRVKGQPERAIEILTDGETPCADSISCLELGHALYESGLRDEAIAAWRRAPNTDIYFAINADRIRDDDPDAPASALEWYGVSQEISSRPAPQKASMFLSLCTLHREAGEVEAAIEMCLLAVESQRTYWTQVELGRTYYEARQFEAAEMVLNEAIASTPNQASAYHWLGLTLYKSGKSAQALEALERAVAFAPANAWIRTDLGYILQLEGAEVDAACQYARALQLTNRPVLASDLQQRLRSLSVDEEELRRCDE